MGENLKGENEEVIIATQVQVIIMKRLTVKFDKMSQATNVESARNVTKLLMIS